MENTSLPEWDCLLPLEMLYRGVIFKNHSFKEGSIYLQSIIKISNLNIQFFKQPGHPLSKSFYGLYLFFILSPFLSSIGDKSNHLMRAISPHFPYH